MSDNAPPAYMITVIPDVNKPWGFILDNDGSLPNPFEIDNLQVGDTLQFDFNFPEEVKGWTFDKRSPVTITSWTPGQMTGSCNVYANAAGDSDTKCVLTLTMTEQTLKDEFWDFNFKVRCYLDGKEYSSQDPKLKIGVPRPPN